MKNFDKLYKTLVENEIANLADDYELYEVEKEREWKADSCGGYVDIKVLSPHNKIEVGWVRVNDRSYLFSVRGSTPASIYKRLADELDKRHIHPSTEHSMYIGKELQRAFNKKLGFKQERLYISKHLLI
jgi:hypothetical protein